MNIPIDYERIVSRAAERIRNGTNMRKDGRAEQIIRAAIIEAVGLHEDERDEASEQFRHQQNR